MKNLLIMVAFLIIASAHASILGVNELILSFTNSPSAITNVTWAGSELSIATNGLGWNGASLESRGFWMQSIPVGIGTSWRPAQSAKVSVEIFPQFAAITFSNGQKGTPSPPSVFARYSPDKKHWSSWQALEKQEHPATNAVFHGLIGVPRSERVKYEQLLLKYSDLDVDWESDEEAAVKWILQREPKFFEKQLPFVGHVEFRIEGSLPGGQRIETIKMQLFWGVGGLAGVPKNPEAEKNREGVWRFKAP
ncbi:MAG: hypothetical protein ABIR24_04265 [Verrucomicrobiota bacterium]